MSRKYRLPGYQDDDRDSDRDRSDPPRRSRRELTSEERYQKRSLRHALDREANEVLRCPVCGNNVREFGTLTPESRCPGCSAALHCCRTCSHFDSESRWQCKAEITEAVGDKTQANQCGQYRPRLVLDVTGRRTTARSSGSNGGGRGGSDPKSQFENLFKR